MATCTSTLLAPNTSAAMDATKMTPTVAPVPRASQTQASDLTILAS